jgi:hypothetical protein
MVFRSLQVLWKKYFSCRLPVKLVQSGGLVYTLYGFEN